MDDVLINSSIYSLNSNNIDLAMLLQSVVDLFDNINSNGFVAKWFDISDYVVNEKAKIFWEENPDIPTLIQAKQYFLTMRIDSQTWKLFVRGMGYKYHEGFYYSDMWNMLNLILVIRFIFLLIKYGLFDALVIILIAFITLIVYIRGFKEALHIHYAFATQCEQLDSLMEASTDITLFKRPTFDNDISRNILQSAMKDLPEFRAQQFRDTVTEPAGVDFAKKILKNFVVYTRLRQDTDLASLTSFSPTSNLVIQETIPKEVESDTIISLESDIRDVYGRYLTNNFHKYETREILAKLGDVNVKEMPSRELKKKLTTITQEIEGRYYIDPLSIIIDRINLINFYPFGKLYYWVYNEASKIFFNFSRLVYGYVKGGFSFVFITRVYKKYTPYLFRWHWTFIFCIEQLLYTFKPMIIDRYSLWVQERLVNPLEKINFQVSVAETVQIVGEKRALRYFSAEVIKKYSNVNIPVLREQAFDLANEASIAMAVGLMLLFIHLGILTFGMLHASCNQYFYCPFIVECVERHCGFRDESRIYSGGHTSWQDRTRLEIKFQGFWHGWLGRGKDKPSIFSLAKRLLIIILRWLLGKNKPNKKKNRKKPKDKDKK